MAVSAPTDKRFRRAHVSPTRRGRRILRLAQGVCYTPALLMVGVVYAGYRARRADVVVGHADRDAHHAGWQREIVRRRSVVAARRPQGRNMLLVDLDEWRTGAARVAVGRGCGAPPRVSWRIDVVVSERQPMGIGHIGDALYLIDEVGDIMDEFGPHHAELDLPVIDGLSAPAVRACPLIRRSTRAERRWPPRFLSSLRERPDLAARVSEVDVSDVRNAVVTLKGDPTMIRVGDDQFVERLQSYLDIVPALRDRMARIRLRGSAFR